MVLLKDVARIQNLLPSSVVDDNNVAHSQNLIPSTVLNGNSAAFQEVQFCLLRSTLA